MAPKPMDDFSVFYETTRPRVAEALAVTFADPDLGAEAADEAFGRAYVKWRRVSRYDNPAGWVYRVGLNWGRRRLSRPQPQPQQEPEPESADVDLRMIVDDAIRSLPLEQRAVVVLRYFLDWRIEEIAQALDLPPGTVKSRLHRAHRALMTKEDLRERA